ncbi:MAG: sigma-70 family RNA polymerase sigma factor [Luteolibacter sp.]|uniref:sigma-70 family RNA polymerase sigma factor n=1 Tax=Luteolibacter sp. TaxID=1962973 RepID=UPI0032668210
MNDPFSTAGNDHTAKVQGLFIQHQPVIRGFVLSMIPDFSLADDVIQETFLIVTKKASSFEIGTSFSAWVKTIARFKALEAIRARKFETLSEEVLEALSTEPHEFAGDIDERLALLRGCINQLPPQARRSINYRYQNEHLPPQIASLTGCTVQSVNVTLSRARAFLRECVQRKMATSPT